MTTYKHGKVVYKRPSVTSKNHRHMPRVQYDPP